MYRSQHKILCPCPQRQRISANPHPPPPPAVHEKVLQQQISDLNAMINAEDVFGLMFRLRCSLSRNQHGMLHEGLFSRAHAGTKVTLEGGSVQGNK